MYTACRLGRAPRNTSDILSNFRRKYFMLVTLQGCLLIFAVMGSVLDVKIPLSAVIRWSYAGRLSQ